MRKVQKLTVKKVVGFSYTTTDLVTFESDSEKGLIRIGGDAIVCDILLDLTEESSYMLMEFFRHVNNELKDSENDKIKVQK